MSPPGRALDDAEACCGVASTMCTVLDEAPAALPRLLDRERAGFELERERRRPPTLKPKRARPLPVRLRCLPGRSSTTGTSEPRTRPSFVMTRGE